MIDVTVQSLASEIQISVDRLIQQFANAGISKSEHDVVTQHEKEILLSYLNHKHGNKNYSNKLILQRKIRSTLNIPSVGGKQKSVKIEFRKKHTYNRGIVESGRINIEKNTEITNNLLIEKENKQKNTNLHCKEKIKNLQFNKNKKTKKINNKIKNNQVSVERIKNQQNQKDLIEFDTAELKRKTEETARYKLEKQARIAVENARLLAEKKADQWNNNEEKDSNTSEYDIRHGEDERYQQIESSHKYIRNNKILRSIKKGNKRIESKKDHEDLKSFTRINKSNKNRNKQQNIIQQVFNKPVQAVSRNIIIGETITVSELANKMAIKGSLVIKAMIKMGAMATINQVLDKETAQLVAEEMGHKVIIRRDNELEESLINDRNIHDAIQVNRAPIVTIMGHVDHGKTSLLDYIRSTKVAPSEAGGITQHIGAYHVKTNNGMITFLDTPGHAAFTAMRARGAQITDIVVLIVAVDDGVMPQTIEAIQHAKAAKVPVIVAINKIDKQGTDPEHIKKELTKYGVVPEEWGGENIFVNVSAKTGIGIDNLLNAILLQAEIMELTAICSGMAKGIVIESFLDKGRGPVATVLVTEGQLNQNDIILCGFEYGRIRAMRNEMGCKILKANPSIPVEILGLSGVPAAGDAMTVVKDEKKAREVAIYRQGKFREIKLARQQKSILDNIFSNVAKSETSELNILLKADVQGSVEAICDSLNKLSTKEIKVNIIYHGVGGITETDATLASASNAIIIGFNVRADASARYIIDNESLKLRYYSVIYDLLNEMKAAIYGMLKPEYKQNIVGLAKIRDVFKSMKFGSIAGCMVTEGHIKRHDSIRVFRNNMLIYEGAIGSLRRFKDDVSEVRNGMECGIVIKNYNDVHVDDIIEAYETIEVKRIVN
ncbi:translation initiation factor IF-2 [Candidatus Pantoea edessiphila]|uniref:Translation initiation factor IF-2 n=1 Tax=Candidatus Pantoea edessiphila TaxID=2044610 RepID=A0A2P5SYA2_9GAMM|nr:translation initiation factor IF-2 [Candidatus Pantoea edessiphila]PPI87283.1 translation initiation factor IF-2 [Candidatus Pantoea edessiphila]